MERQFNCLFLSGPQSLPIGVRSAPGKSSGAGDYRAGWFLLEDDTIELDDAMGWEPLTYEIDRAYFENEMVSLTLDLSQP
jgi:hypothetical protein